MDLIVIGLPAWLWIAAFLGCFGFGGICAGMLIYAIGVRPLLPYRDFVERDTLPMLWEPEPDPDPCPDP